MINRIDIILLCILIGIICVLGIKYVNVSNDLNRCQTQQFKYQTQINTIMAESQEEIRRYEDARKQAQFEMNQIQGETRKVLATRVPKDCNKAMAWGINEARRFASR